MRVIYLPAIAIVLLLMCATGYFYIQESSYTQGMSTTSATIVGFGSKSRLTTNVAGARSSTDLQPIAEFQIDDKTYRIEGRALGYPRWQLGQSVDVFFFEQNPYHSRIKRFDELYFYSLLSAFFLITVFLSTLLNVVLRKFLRSEQFKVVS